MRIKTQRFGHRILLLQKREAREVWNKVESPEERDIATLLRCQAQHCDNVPRRFITLSTAASQSSRSARVMLAWQILV